MPEAGRIQKLNEVIRAELAKIILKEIDLPKGVLSTIAEVETYKDLSGCKVFISVFPKTETAKVLKILSRQSYNLHQILNKKLFIRKVPKLFFQEGKNQQKTQRLEQLLDEVDQGKY